MRSKRTLTVWMIALMNLAAITNIKNFPLMAVYGYSIVPLLLFSSLFFFIPVSLVSAELATGWPDRGVYTWVKEGMGKKWGFVAVWLQWIENVIWYPSILSFIASTSAYLFDPALATNKLYVLTVLVSTFWFMTYVNFSGMRTSGWISSASALFGTILPIVLIFLLGLFWVAKPDVKPAIAFTPQSLLPNFTSFSELVLLAGFLLGLGGMEMSAVHAKEVQNPQKNYPKAIFLSAAFVLLLSAIGSLIIAMVVPLDALQLTSGGIEAFSYLLAVFNLKWAVPLIAFIIVCGALGMMSTWIVGPSRGLFASALDGDLPPFFQKTNKANMPIGVLLIQAFIVTALSLVFLLMPTINSSYWILVALASILYLFMYLLMFIAAIRLRYTHPHVERSYKIPGGKIGMWIVAGAGFFGSAFAAILGFFPPAQVNTGSLLFYEGFLIGGVVFFVAIPLFLFRFRNPAWKKRA